MLPFALWDSADALCPPRLAPPVVLTHPKIKGFLISFFSLLFHSWPLLLSFLHLSMTVCHGAQDRKDLKMDHGNLGFVGLSLSPPGTLNS